MNLRIPAVLAVLIIPFAMAADDEVSVQIDRVHLCCSDCTEGVERAVSSVKGAGATADENAGTVTIWAPDKAVAQKAVNALVTAGYFGVSRDPAIKVEISTGARDTKVKGVEITGVHVCCRSCVSLIEDAVSSVPGVTGTNATAGSTSFQVKGEFNEKSVLDALLDAGFAGKVERTSKN